MMSLPILWAFLTVCSFSPGNWSRLGASFGFVRRSGYFLIHIYAPCALIVILSWISFCIPPDATAARIALGITSVLTITTILNMLNTAMPKVRSCWIFTEYVTKNARDRKTEDKQRKKDKDKQADKHNLFLFSRYHIPTYDVTLFSTYKHTYNPQFLHSLWRRANARNGSLHQLSW